MSKFNDIVMVFYSPVIDNFIVWNHTRNWICNDVMQTEMPILNREALVEHLKSFDYEIMVQL